MKGTITELILLSLLVVKYIFHQYISNFLMKMAFGLTKIFFPLPKQFENMSLDRAVLAVLAVCHILIKFSVLLSYSNQLAAGVIFW
jgi:hypothetical protein